MNTDTNPIDLLIVSIIALIEGICWVINELMGHHEAKRPVQPHINPLFTDLHSLTVKQLRQITGIKSSRYRKADLILAIA